MELRWLSDEEIEGFARWCEPHPHNRDTTRTAIRAALSVERMQVVEALRKCVEYSGYKTRAALVELIQQLSASFPEPSA